VGSEEGRHVVRAWSDGGVLLESYRYAPGPAAETPRHSHGDYQLCLSPNFPGEYRYRGESHAVPVGSLSVIHPGEIHSAHDPRDREIFAEYRMVYAKPSVFQRVVAEIAGHEGGLPTFPAPVVLDEHLARSFFGMHSVLEGAASALKKDSHLLSVLSEFVVRWANERLSPKRLGNEPRAVGLAREYLEDDPAENVSLEELSRIANLSPYHFCRVFKKEVGIPPHAYQINVRLDRAKDLLLRGWTISEVVRKTGFYDQSHFTHSFKRLVGVTPGSYAKNSKIFQD
jgi:AraC-like DNA-binding protein